MNYHETVDYLYHLGHEVLAADYRLGRIERLLVELDQPQEAYPSIIIAGTNGKGSVAAMMDSILRQAGLRTGLYTSPHLVSPCERIKVGGKEIASEAFADHATRILEASARLITGGAIKSMPTFFEHVTATGFSYFRQQQVDLAVLEVGLGGRLDAANTASSFLAILTQIDFDHEKILGSTLGEIAAEKAAIIKPGATAVVAPQREEVANVIRQHCQQQGLTPRFVLRDPTQVWIQHITADGRVTFSFGSGERVYENIRLALRGYHQIENAVVAIEAAEELRRYGYPITTEAIIEGLQTVVWPGRLESLGGWGEQEWRLDGSLSHPVTPSPRHPVIVLDGAHNPAGANALRRYLEDFRRRPLTLVFGAMRDKRIQDMAAALFPLAQQVILTRVQDERSAELGLLKRVAAGYGDVRLTESVEEAMRQALMLTPAEGMICVTGSLYLVGAVKQCWPIVQATVGIDEDHSRSTQHAARSTRH
ncbi:MAG: bifunctional folylpolyglutamate synthase/dihydrofolate synthase [Acidobacteria bacterium]|nr:bifunctional folylpolyglutamate synthase/dihydrofolate synthase [Acidobacteriota bacterium]